VPQSEDDVRANVARRCGQACAAWLCLHGMSILLAVCGFDRTYRLATGSVARRVRHGRAAGDGAPPALADVVAKVTRALVDAKRWHLRMTEDDCLPVALTGMWLLRWRGLEGHLVLGVKRYPFGAHAWVQVHECVIDFPPDMHKQFVGINMGR
jgi:hypothetical protein